MQNTLQKIEWPGLTISHTGDGYPDEIESNRLPSLRFDLEGVDTFVVISGDTKTVFLKSGMTQLEADMAFTSVVTYYGAAHNVPLETIQHWLREINANPIKWSRAD